MTSLMRPFASPARTSHTRSASLAVLLWRHAPNAWSRALADIAEQAGPALALGLLERRGRHTCAWQRRDERVDRLANRPRSRVRAEVSARPGLRSPRITSMRGNSSFIVTARYGYDLSSLNTTLKRGSYFLIHVCSRMSASTSVAHNRPFDGRRRGHHECACAGAVREGSGSSSAAAAADSRPCRRTPRGPTGRGTDTRQGSSESSPAWVGSLPGWSRFKPTREPLSAR